MKPAFIIRFCASLTLLAALAAQADTTLLHPTWTLQEAREAAAQVDTHAAAEALFRLSRAARNDELLRALEALANRAEWARPAREEALHLFALGLADLPPGSVSRDVLDWLFTYSPQTLVRDEDYPLLGVPLYRIRAAAAGTLYAWERQAAATEAGRLLERGPDTWLEAFLVADPARQRGLLEALDSVEERPLRGLADEALGRLADEPALTEVPARAGVLLSDPTILQAVVTRGGGPGLAPALRSAARDFDEVERADLLIHAIRHAPASNASLAIAQLAPGLLHQPEISELLFGKLRDRAIGAAAALALANSKDPDVLERLNDLARGGAGLEARRAVIAVEMARTAQTGTAQ